MIVLMSKRVPLDSPTARKLHAKVQTTGLRATARETGVHPGTITRALAGNPVEPQTAVALSRIGPKVRDASEFDRLRRELIAHVAPQRPPGPFVWDLQAIRAARDDQIRGRFKQPVRLAAAMRTDDALFNAYITRLSPHTCIEARLTPAPGARGEACANRARASVVTSRQVLEGILGTLVNHGLSIGINRWRPSDDGTRVDCVLEEWPLEHVTDNPLTNTLETATRDGQTVPIIHGDGTWVIFRRVADRPWLHDACILPAALVWAAHAGGISDMAASARAHGLAQVIGELPAGVNLSEDDGATLTAEAQAFLSMLRDIGSGEAAVGLRPAGSKTDFLSNQSTAWQIFVELIQDRAKAAARIYLGTDATLGSIGGAPGVDIAELFGVATTKTQGDFECLETGLNTGVYAPWAAINMGSSLYAPRVKYQLPDPDAERKREERAKNYERFVARLAAMRDQKLIVDQAMIDRAAADFGIEPVPQLAPITEQTVSLVLAPTDVALVVRGREARAAQGLPAFGDERDDMTLGELKTYVSPGRVATGAPAAPQPPPAS